ncbi:MAG: ATP-dependent metallopeptidase FtsH/Yme1/Tma family protein, partial [Pseudomonadota bacterium]
MGNSKNLAFWLVVFLLVVALFQVFNASSSSTSSDEVSYSEFLNRVDTGQVVSVRLDGEQVLFRGTDARQYMTVRPLESDLTPILRDANVEISAQPQEQSGFLSTLIVWLPFLLLIGVWIYFMNRMQGGRGGGAMGFG